MQGDIAWHRLFTQRLNSDVLLVGPTVSCEGTPNRLNMSELRQNPHVQSFVLATNRVRSQPSLMCSRTHAHVCKRCPLSAQAGFKTLLQDGNVLKCWSERLDAIYHAELGASAAILRAGFNLDCLLQRCGPPAGLYVLQPRTSARNAVAVHLGACCSACADALLFSCSCHMQVYYCSSCALRHAAQVPGV